MKKKLVLKEEVKEEVFNELLVLASAITFIVFCYCLCLVF